MPSQSSFMTNVVPLVAQALGVQKLDGGTISESDLIEVITQSGLAAVVEISTILGLVSFALSSKVATDNAGATFTTNAGLLINKTIAGPTPVLLPTPSLSRIIFIHDMKGDAGTNNITLDAGSGKLINGLRTLVMNANYGSTMLVGGSATQWCTLF